MCRCVFRKQKGTAEENSKLQPDERKTEKNPQLPTYLCILSPTLPGSFSSSLLEISSSHGLPSSNKRRRAHGCRVQKANSRSLSLESTTNAVIPCMYRSHYKLEQASSTPTACFKLLGRHPSFTPPVARAVVYAPYLSLSRSRNRVCWPRPTCNIWPLARSAEESFKSAGFDKRISTVARADADNALGGTSFVAL